MSLFSPFSPSSSKRHSRRVGVSPVDMSNILGSMYAHKSPSTSYEGQTSSSVKSWEGETRGNHPLHRTASDEERKVAAKAPRLSNRPKTSAGGGSRSASRKFVTPLPTGSQSATMVDQQRQLSPSASRVSDESSSASTLRLVGRGGSGSKFRVVAPQPSALDINALPKSDPAIQSEARPPPPEVKTFHRPSGRGGIGARKKSLEAPPAVLSRIPLKKVLSTKFRKDSSSGNSVRSVESIAESSESTSPRIPHRIRKGSFFTRTYDANASSDGIHYSPRSIPEHEDGAEPLEACIPPLSPSLSTFEDVSECATPASGRPKKNFTKLAKMLGELPPHEIYEQLYRQQHLMQAVPLHNTLPDHKAAVKMSRRSSIAAGIYSLFSSTRNPASTASHSTLSTTADGLHPGIFADDISDSWGRDSSFDVTRSVDDFGLQSNLRCETPESPMMFSPPSPNLAPTHQVVQTVDTHIVAAVTNVPGSPTLKPIPALEIDTSTLDRADSSSSPSSSSPTTPVPTLHRSRSQSHELRRPSVRTSRSASVSLSVEGFNANANTLVNDHDHDRQLNTSRASTPFSTIPKVHKWQTQNLPELSHWLKPPNAPADAYSGHDVFNAYRSDSTAKKQAWSGEWNTEMQDVIRALRLLR